MRPRVHRYYDPATGQFLTVDAAVDLTGQPYGYAAGNPVNEGDPTGFFACAVRNEANHFFAELAGYGPVGLPLPAHRSSTIGDQLEQPAFGGRFLTHEITLTSVTKSGVPTPGAGFVLVHATAEAWFQGAETVEGRIKVLNQWSQLAEGEDGFIALSVVSIMPRSKLPSDGWIDSTAVATGSKGGESVMITSTVGLNWRTKETR
jgi:uncharacterized protein RhaS with RHS repeats